MNKINLETTADLYISPSPTIDVDKELGDRVADLILHKIPVNSRVLEMGVGHDSYTARTISRFGHSYIVEGSSRLGNWISNSYGADVTVYQSNFETFAPEEGFDVVLATNVLEHMDDPVACLSRVALWLNTGGGRVFVQVPNARSVHRLIGVELGLLKSPLDFSESDVIVGHKRVFVEETIERVFKESGFCFDPVKGRLPTFVKFLANAQMADYTDLEINTLFSLAKNTPLNFQGSLLYELTRC